MAKQLLVLLLLALATTTGHCQDPSPPTNPDVGQQPPGDPAAVPPGGSTGIRPPKEQGPDPAASTAPVIPSPSPSPSVAPAVPSPSPSPAPAVTAAPGTAPQPSPKPAAAAGPQPTAATAPPPGAVPPGGVTPAPGAAGTAPGAGAGAVAPGATASGAVAPGAVTPPSAGVTPPGTPPAAGAIPGAAAGAGAVPGVPGVPGIDGVVPVVPPVEGAAAGTAAGTVPGVTPGISADPAAAGAIPLGPDGTPLGVYVPKYPASNASSNATNPENTTSIDGISPEDNSDKLVNALLGALGAKRRKVPLERSNANPIAVMDDGSGRTGSSRTTRRGRTGSQRRRRNSSNRTSTRASLPSAALQGATFQDLRGSNKLSEGLLTTSDGSEFCVAGRDMVAEPLSNPANNGKLTFASRPELHDPACDDPAIDKSKFCTSASLTTPFVQAKFMDTAESAVTPAATAAEVVPPVAGLLNPAVANASALACTQGFTKMGSTPRSLAVVLIKWGRQYYKTKEECCREFGNAPDCDCKWNGFTYDNLPPPSAYSRMFTDECDGKPSINRAYFDLSGGMVTFHGKTRVPTPAASMAELAIRNGSRPPPQDPMLLNSVPGYVTEKSYLDPDGVDVYGWATLDQMRENGDGNCLDWCGEGIKQLGVNSSEYNHVMCMALYSQSTTICDSCDSAKTACSGSCPASSGISTGCGCGTCSFAWGGQSSCNKPAGPGVRTGLHVQTAVYDDKDAPLLPGMPPRSYVKIVRSNKVYMSHELGHNMGLTHTGSLKCSTAGGVVNRQPEGCTPDWYGDTTSFMGSGPDLQLPNAMKYRVRWLPRGTLREHVSGTDTRYTLTASTARRPSWQDATATQLQWFDATTDVLAVRIPLVNPSPEVAQVGAYKCPCPACPQCTADACRASTASSCCTDASCADGKLRFYYIELHQPYANDNNPEFKGIAVRMMGDLSTCTSTRAVATHLDAEGKPQLLLNTPDPAGVAIGSKFEDPLRRVTVILEQWTLSQAVVRVIA